MHYFNHFSNLFKIIMTKQLIIATIASLIVAVSSAKASTNIYAGLEVGDNHYKLSTNDNGDFSYQKSYINPGIFAGYHFPKNIDLEASYSQGYSSKSAYGRDITEELFNFKAEIRTKTYAVDVIKSYEVNQKIKVFALAGLEYRQILIKEIAAGVDSSENNETLHSKVSGINPSIGLGVSYAINQDFSIRVKGKYSFISLKPKDMNELNKIGNSYALSIGAFYNF
jgi:opacity protein-like surface antigen